MSVASIRSLAGAAILDLPRSFRLLQRPNGWVFLTNRADQYAVSNEPVGLRIQSELTSSLYVADVFPWFGRTLFRSCLAEWRFEFSSISSCASPEFTFIIPHRGVERLPQLLMTLESIGALKGQVECIVVEQDSEKRIQLPDSVVHLHAPYAPGDSAWRKCFAFNRGAMIARGRYLVLHDGDILVPRDYLQRLRWHFLTQQVDVVYPQRFLFYLTQHVTERLVVSKNPHEILSDSPEMIKQNWTGGTLAIQKMRSFVWGDLTKSSRDGRARIASSTIDVTY